jgi:hypothetical protein
VSAAARTSSSSAAEFIGPTQNHVRALVDELRLTRNGAHQDRIAGGTQEIALGVARRLRRC